MTSFIYSQDVYDILLDKIEITSQSKMMVEQVVSYYAKQKPNVTLEEWEKVKSKIDYSTFISSVKNVFKTYYTIEDAKTLIQTIEEYGINAYKPKPEVTKAMYVLGKGFGVQIGEQINAKLKDLEH